METRLSDIDWELVYDYQKSDYFDKKSVTVKVYNHNRLMVSQAIVVDEITSRTKKKQFKQEDCESAALRWANNVSNEIIFAKKEGE